MTLIFFFEAFQNVRFASRDLKPAMAAGLPGMTRHTNIPWGRKRSMLCFLWFEKYWTLSMLCTRRPTLPSTSLHRTTHLEKKGWTVNLFFDKFNPILEESIHRRAIRKGQTEALDPVWRVPHYEILVFLTNFIFLAKRDDFMGLKAYCLFPNL